MREFAPHTRYVVAVSTFVIGLCVAAPIARAQIAPGLGLGGAVEVGGEAERYLRVLQLTGAVPLSPWAVLPLAASAERTLVPRGAHPWEARFAAPAFEPPAQWLRPMALSVVNSAYPFQGEAGPMWFGRGVNVAVQGGLAARWRRVRVQLAPLAFIAQNAPFTLAPNGASGAEQFGDERFPGNIDHPQRFGNSAYGRIDPGTSTVALDLNAVAAGITSAPERWGPASEYPLLLGPGAGGFPRAFLGTARPVELGIVRFQARLIAGYLAQSDYSAAPADASQRVASAAVVGISARGIDGLEIGFARFFESTEGMSLRRILRPIGFHGLVGQLGDSVANRTENVANENQLASLFFRWALPAGGVEVYGEWLREDYPGDFRKLLLKPDDLSSFMVGFRRVLIASSSRQRIVRLEAVNGELSHQERAQRGFEEPLPPYVHPEVVQGHTHRGLLLGSAEAYGGAGWRASLDDYTDRGRVSVGIERALRLDWLPGQTPTTTGTHPDVVYALRFEMLRFAGGRDYTVVLVPAVDLNRNLVRGADRVNLHAGLSVRGW